MSQRNDNVQAKIRPVWLKPVETIGPPLASNAARVRVEFSAASTDTRASLSNSLFNLVLLSLSQKLIVPSAPEVEKVP